MIIPYPYTYILPLKSKKSIRLDNLNLISYNPDKSWRGEFFMRSVEKIRRKFGNDAFRKWGKSGGSEILRAWKEGRVTIHEKPKRRKSS